MSKNHRMTAKCIMRDKSVRMVFDYAMTKVIDGMVCVSSKNGEGFIFPSDTVVIIEIEEDEP